MKSQYVYVRQIFGHGSKSKIVAHRLFFIISSSLAKVPSPSLTSGRLFFKKCGRQRPDFSSLDLPFCSKGKNQK